MDAKPDRYFEEFLLSMEGGQYPKCLGIRLQDGNPDNRVLGYYGKKEFMLTEPLVLKRGHREVVVKASVKRPIKVFTMLQKVGR